MELFVEILYFHSWIFFGGSFISILYFTVDGLQEGTFNRGGTGFVDPCDNKRSASSMARPCGLSALQQEDARSFLLCSMSWTRGRRWTPNPVNLLHTSVFHKTKWWRHMMAHCIRCCRHLKTNSFFITCHLFCLSRFLIDFFSCLFF